MELLIWVTLIMYGFQQAQCACQLPLNPGVWHSSTKGDWVIPENRTSVSGYLAHLSGLPTETLDCIQQYEDSKYILGVDFEIFVGVTITVYTCLEFQPIKHGASFTYLVITPVDDTTGERFTSNITKVCSTQEFTSVVDTHVVVREGEHSDSATELPNLILGNFDVEIKANDSEGNSTNLITMDACTNKSVMAFNNSGEADNETWLADAGRLISVYAVTLDETTYVHTFDDNVSESSHRFACWVFSKNGDTIHGTVYPNECHPEQTSTYVNPPGLTLALVSSFTCGDPIEGQDSPTVPLGIILGSTAGGVALVVAILTAIVVRHRCMKNNDKYTASDEETTKEPNVDSEDVVVEETKTDVGNSKRFSNGVIHQSFDEVMNGTEPYMF